MYRWSFFSRKAFAFFMYFCRFHFQDPVSVFVDILVTMALHTCEYSTVTGCCSSYLQVCEAWGRWSWSLKVKVKFWGRGFRCLTARRDHWTEGSDGASLCWTPRVPWVYLGSRVFCVVTLWGSRAQKWGETWEEEEKTIRWRNYV